ncbi:MAG: PSD1 domain-containing protein [Planctomycetales bacterium]|nr:PSD1 domain-containing protein [Planctomycetales bacterium]
MKTILVARHTPVAERLHPTHLGGYYVLRSILTTIAVLLLGAVAQAADDVSEGEKLFVLRVKPLLAQKCLACHGDDPHELGGGLNMNNREALLVGGEEFGSKSIVVGKAQESWLYRAVTRKHAGYEMPPKEADGLTEQQQWWIRDWIDAGAPWPDPQRIAAIQESYAEGEQVSTSKALSAEWQERRYDPSKLWAYRPIKPQPVPPDRHPVDWFIERELEFRGITAAPDCESQKLVRRMSFGLTGLPPTPQQVDQFCAMYANNSESAVREFADQLMATAEYGEHFARQWLDVVRYADTAGFANDYCRPNAWRYRDYVVRAFNADKPFDQFVLEQIAGDELDAREPEHLIATGFLRMGPWEQTGMSVFKETRQQWLDDVTDTVGQAFLGHALQCAKCHDHKFDPVPTRDYYRIQAIFSTTQFAEREVPFLASENLAWFAESQRWVTAKIESYQQQELDLQKHIQAALQKESGGIKVGDNGLDPGDEASLARMRKNVSRHQLELRRTEPLALAVYTGNTIERKNVEGELPVPQDPWAQGELPDDSILAGGDVYSPVEAVEPGGLSVLASLGGMAESQFPGGQGKRRLAFAQWLIDRRNPLTARVLVNRVWAWHFGKGLAANPNNFGATGGDITHPVLLDNLAHWFMENGWSIKKLNALIVSSRAYRRATLTSSAAIDNRTMGEQWYAGFSPRRLTAEELRDAMLSASGELNREIGGIPARPDLNLEVAFQPRQIMGGTASVYEPDPLPAQRNRRSIYTERVRGLRDPFLETFNQPSSERSCELRETSIVAPQALTLFNSSEVHDRARALAVRLLTESEDQVACVEQAFRLTLSRLPNEIELQACMRHWNEATDEESAKSYAPQEFGHSIFRTVMAEKTGEPYSFEEKMPAYVDYRPDVQASDIDAQTRGLAQVCLILFNLNEFIYLD